MEQNGSIPTNNLQFCTDCGNQYSRRTAACPKCGCPNDTANAFVSNKGQKERVVYILYGFFLGYFGIHNFYSGHTGRGIAKIILTCLLITAPIATLWSLVEVCTVKADAHGVPFA